MAETLAAQNKDGESRRRRPWIAFLLNLFFPPTGYVYAGPLRAALTILALVISIGAVAPVWTIDYPPGVYGIISKQSHVLILGLVTYFIQAVIGVHAAALCRRPPAWHANGAALWLTALGLWALSLAIAMLARAFGPIAIYSVRSASMEPTLSVGDIVWTRGARAVCGDHSVEAGDVVIFRRRGTAHVTRVIAHGAQRVEMRAGRPIIDGKPVVQRPLGRPISVGIDSSPGGAPLLVGETLSQRGEYRILEFKPGFPQDDVAPALVPPAYWFALGDNRDNSSDSRFEGPIRGADICGVVVKILFSKDRARIGARP